MFLPVLKTTKAAVSLSLEASKSSKAREIVKSARTTEENGYRHHPHGGIVGRVTPGYDPAPTSELTEVTAAGRDQCCWLCTDFKWHHKQERDRKKWLSFGDNCFLVVRERCITTRKLAYVVSGGRIFVSNAHNQNPKSQCRSPSHKCEMCRKNSLSSKIYISCVIRPIPSSTSA